LTQAIQNGETWYIKDATVLTLNYAFIEMVMNAYSSLPIAEYRIRNGGERGQQLAVTTSHESVVALLTYKASMNSHAKPKQTHVANVYQLNNYGSQKKMRTISLFFSHIILEQVAIGVMWQLGAVISNGSLTILIDAVVRTVPVHLNPIVPINITLLCWDSSMCNPAKLRILM
jgi:hypothetical protein